MNAIHTYLIGGLWVLWIAIWFAAAVNVKQNARQESPMSRMSHGLPLMISAWLIIAPVAPIAILNERFMTFAEWQFWTGAALVAGGVAFMLWARWCLGRNWSGTVTVKRDHELIRTGPYRWVRNPIYTGLLAALAGSAFARGQWSGVVAVVIAFGAVWLKARIEERWMHETFGPRYDAYRDQVASLIPFVL